MYDDDRYSSYTRTDERFSNYRQNGFFKISYPFEGLWIIAVTLASVLLFIFLSGIGGEPKNIAVLLQNILAYIFSFLFPIALFMFGTAFVLAGKTLNYSADNDKFIILSKRGNPPPVMLYYKNVSNVTYENRHFLFWDRGFTVTITDKAGKIYKYPIIHNSVSKRDGPQALPFHILEERAGLIDKPDYAGKY